jgi:hypothetical protein
VANFANTRETALAPGEEVQRLGEFRVVTQLVPSMLYWIKYPDEPGIEKRRRKDERQGARVYA